MKFKKLTVASGSKITKPIYPLMVTKKYLAPVIYTTKIRVNARGNTHPLATWNSFGSGRGQK